MKLLFQDCHSAIHVYQIVNLLHLQKSESLILLNKLLKLIQ